jgi:two-component system nitrogen regulation response regulator NtrX
VGGEQTFHVSVRVISATNRDLQQMAACSRFREDLLYRLTVVPIRVPPLRERKEDIRPLTEYFLREFCLRNNFRPKAIEEDLFEILRQHDWPGNVRELRNAVERMAILSPGELITAAAVPWELRQPAAVRSNLQQTREAAERDSILKALEATGWNVAAAARTLGIERTALHKRIRALGIVREIP